MAELKRKHSSVLSDCHEQDQSNWIDFRSWKVNLGVGEPPCHVMAALPSVNNASQSLLMLKDLAQLAFESDERVIRRWRERKEDIEALE